MLMGASNITLKEQIKHFDEGITKPFIKAMYFWNMEFNPKENIKGDYNVVCKGTTSLIAKEVRAESINQFMMMTNNEVDLLYTNRDVLLREVTKIMDLDDIDLIKNRSQVEMDEKRRQKEMEENRQFEKELALLKAKSGGHVQNDAALTGGGIRPDMENLSPEELQSGLIPEVSVG